MCKVIEDMRAQERQEGLQQGLLESAKKSALRMLAAGKYGMDEILDISGLTLEEVKQLQAETST